MYLSIGIDLDNTLASYDQSLGRIATDFGIASAGLSKRAMRDAIRVRGGDTLWQQVQAQIYGPRMREAALAPGAMEFLHACRDSRARIWIVSHKTEYSPVDPLRTPLRVMAREWLEARGIHAAGVSPEDVFFESSREAKLRRIASTQVRVFIDDLIEVLDDPGFPRNVSKIHYCQDMAEPATSALAFPHFDDIRRHLFGA